MERETVTDRPVEAGAAAGGPVVITISPDGSLDQARPEQVRRAVAELAALCRPLCAEFGGPALVDALLTLACRLMLEIGGPDAAQAAFARVCERVPEMALALRRPGGRA